MTLDGSRLVIELSFEQEVPGDADGEIDREFQLFVSTST